MRKKSELLETWIEAYKKTLSAYEKNEHECEMASCHKCTTSMSVVNEFSCCACPESMFMGDSGYGLGCLKRKCAPMDLPALDHYEAEVEAVIEYHKLSIAMMEKRSNFSAKQIGTKLKQIDAEVSNRFQTRFTRDY